MILPHPESNFSLNIMVLGADIITQLKPHKNFILTETVLNDFLLKEEKRTPEMFVNTLTFLFAMGLIEKKAYRIKLIPRINSIQRDLFKDA